MMESHWLSSSFPFRNNCPLLLRSGSAWPESSPDALSVSRNLLRINQALSLPGKDKAAQNAYMKLPKRKEDKQKE